MPDWLPTIDIAVPEEHGAFLRRMGELGVASTRFETNAGATHFRSGGIEVRNFRSLQESAHSGLGFQLISRDDIPGRVLVELRAARWNPEPPLRATYIEAARSLVLPLLKAYNAAHSTRYRLRIECTPRDRVIPTARTTALLNRFTLLANKNALHPLDWNRFYQFVSESRQELPEHEIRILLGSAGFGPNYAAHIAEIYTHLWAFKRRR